jgi:hypothetical protein
MIDALRDLSVAHDLDAPCVQWSQRCDIAGIGDNMLAGRQRSRRLDGYDGQVLLAVEVADLEPDLCAAHRAKSFSGLRRETRSWLDAGLLVRALAPEIDLDRRGAAQRRMGAARIVPTGVQRHQSAHRGEREWHYDRSDPFVLDAADGALGDGDRTVLSDGAKARLDAAALAPIAIPRLFLRVTIR